LGDERERIEEKGREIEREGKEKRNHIIVYFVDGEDR